MGTLDFDSLLREISPESPCGEDLEYDAEFIALSQNIQGTPEQQIGSRIEPAQPPVWKDIRKAVFSLLPRTRDLRLLQFLARTLLAIEGFPGLREALLLTEKSIEQYWPSIFPQLDPDDDNDPTQRVNILMGFCDFETFLRPIAQTPLVDSRAAGRFCLRDIQFATGALTPPPKAPPPPERSLIAAAFQDTDVGVLRETLGAISACLESLNSIESQVTDQVGVGNAPNFAELRTLIKEAKHHFTEFSGDRLTENPEGSTATEGGESAEEGNSSQKSSALVGKVALAAINSRQDVIKALDLICEYYSKYEPSSPIPLLMQRSKRLVPMSFMEILAELAPEGINQINVIKGQDS